MARHLTGESIVPWVNPRDVEPNRAGILISVSHDQLQLAGMRRTPAYVRACAIVSPRRVTRVPLPNRDFRPFLGLLP